MVYRSVDSQSIVASRWVRCILMAIVSRQFRSTRNLDLFEIRRVVAALAITTEFAVVFIVAHVAAVALLGDFCGFGGRAMAIAALQFGVRAIQRKFGLRGVIEFPALPAVGVVT